MNQSSRAFLDSSLIAKLGNLPLFARRPMVGSVSGRHRSPHRGSSVEFAEYRKYVPGDDTRRLDWRAWGRSDRFYIKEFEADTNLRLLLVCDTSGSMGYSRDGVSKLDVARRIAATLGYLAAQQGDAVGLSCAAGGLTGELPPLRKSSHLRAVLDVLADVRPKGPTGLVDALHAVAEKNAQRALVVILSDLFVEPEELRACFQHLRFRKHDVAVFHLLEERELSFDFTRPTRFVDLEGGSPLLVEPDTIRRRYHDALETYFDGLREVLREAEVDYRRLELADPLEDILAAFLLGRAPKGARS